MRKSLCTLALIAATCCTLVASPAFAGSFNPNPPQLWRQPKSPWPYPAQKLYQLPKPKPNQYGQKPCQHAERHHYQPISHCP